MIVSEDCFRGLRYSISNSSLVDTAAWYLQLIAGLSILPDIRIPFIPQTSVDTLLNLLRY